MSADEPGQVLTPKLPEHDPAGIQEAAEAHLEAVWKAYYRDEDGEVDEDDDGAESPAVGPFCGCETCVIREVLAAAWPHIENYFRVHPVTDTPEQ